MKYNNMFQFMAEKKKKKKQKTDYSNACIYTIETKDGLYVGSSKNFKNRKDKHRNNISNKNSKDYNLKVYKNIRKNGEWKMKILKPFPCDNVVQLEAEEQLCIYELNPNLNVRRSMGFDSQEYYENNKEKIREGQKEYYENNREKIREGQKEYYENNREKYIEKQKDYYENNREKYNSRKKEKITCECGAVISRGNILQHKKSTKHIDYLIENS